jgi:hypothetical protein
MYAIVLPEGCVDYFKVQEREYARRPCAAKDAFLAVHYDRSQTQTVYVSDLADLYDIAWYCVAPVEHV